MTLRILRLFDRYGGKRESSRMSIIECGLMALNLFVLEDSLQSNQPSQRSCEGSWTFLTWYHMQMATVDLYSILD